RNRSGALPDRGPVRVVRGHDAQPVRDRVPGKQRRRALDDLPVPLQSAGSGAAAGGRYVFVCALSAQVRMEPVVRIAGELPQRPLGGGDRGAAAAGKRGRGRTVRGESVFRRAAAGRAGGDLAVLVRDPEGKAIERRLVDPKGTRLVRARAYSLSSGGCSAGLSSGISPQPAPSSSSLPSCG